MSALRSKHGRTTAAALSACLGGRHHRVRAGEEGRGADLGQGPAQERCTAKMAPVAAPPMPTPADKLPKLTAPAGFKVETYASGILDARALRRGDKGTIFVSSLFVAGKIYAVTGATANARTRPSPAASSCRTASSSTMARSMSPRPSRSRATTRSRTTSTSRRRRSWSSTSCRATPTTAGSTCGSGPTASSMCRSAHPATSARSDADKYVQILRVNADGAGKRWLPAACATRWASTSTRAPRSCGSRTISATGCRRTSRSMS